MCVHREHETVSFANGGLVAGDMPPWVDKGCDYMIPRNPVDMPQLWDGDNS